MRLIFTNWWYDENMKKIDKLIQEIKADNEEFTAKGWEPILKVSEKAKVVLIGQAPGIKTQLKKDVFRDASGERLRDWLGVDEKLFYDSGLFAVLPLDFYFPGKAKTGDKPPRKGFAQKWHPQLLELMPDVELIILMGTYAAKEYLKDGMKKNLTETVKAYEEYLPKYFPLVHPSPLNQRWMSKNRWFEEDLIPKLQERIKDLIN